MKIVTIQEPDKYKNLKSMPMKLLKKIKCIFELLLGCTGSSVRVVHTVKPYNDVQYPSYDSK